MQFIGWLEYVESEVMEKKLHTVKKKEGIQIINDIYQLSFSLEMVQVRDASMVLALKKGTEWDMVW